MSQTLYAHSQVHNFHSTCNYARFKFAKTNRPIDQDHLMRLYDAISAKNLLAEFPILVDKEMSVIDGQHRLKVAESLGIPIYYLVSERITVDDISATNANTLHWRLSDYMDRWLADGKTDYLVLKRFMNKYPFFTLAEAMELCHYGNKYGLKHKFHDGEYKCNDVPYATKVAKALLDFSKFFAHYHDKSFINAVANLIGNRNYDHGIMMARIEYQSRKLVRCADMDSYIATLNDIYNYRTAQKNRVTLRKLMSGELDWRPDRKQQEHQMKLDGGIAS